MKNNAMVTGPGLPAVLALVLNLASPTVTAMEELIIDVRTPGEFQTGHAMSAINLPHDRIHDLIGQFAESADQPIVLYCRSGQRSEYARQVLAQLGYSNVTNAGGLEAIPRLDQ